MFEDQLKTVKMVNKGLENIGQTSMREWLCNSQRLFFASEGEKYSHGNDDASV